MLSWLSNPILNRAEIARQIDMPEDVFYRKYKKIAKQRFTPAELSRLAKVKRKIILTLSK